MNDYETFMKEQRRIINSQKIIHKCSILLNSLQGERRYQWFEICRNHLNCVYNMNNTITLSERNLIQNIINHWDWNTFEQNSSLWWNTIFLNYSNSDILINLLRLWVNNDYILDDEQNETSTLGIR